MINKIRLPLAVLALVVLFLPIVSVSAFNPVDSTCDSLPDTDQRSESEVCNDADNPSSPISGDGNIFITIANVLSIVAGVIAVIVIIVSGITMMTSGGDPAKVKTSRDGIIYAVIGLVVIVVSRSLVIYVIGLVG